MALGSTQPLIEMSARNLPGKEWERKHVKLIVRNLIYQSTRFPIGFSAGVTLVFIERKFHYKAYTFTTANYGPTDHD
jgi:hypothetical protein